MKTWFLITVIILQCFYAVFSIPLATKSIDLDEHECKDKRDDCHWISDNHYDIPKYCWAHRNDAFIKDCPKYCGFCKIKAPAPPVVCEDTRSDCDWINNNGENKESYCYRNRNDPGVKQCAKTCGFCKLPAPPRVISKAPAPPVACEDTRDDCSWIGKHNDDVAAYCDRHKNDAFIKQCQRTCGYCKAPAPPIACEDTRDDCSWIGKHNHDVAAYCDRHKNDAFIKQCQRTCGYCKAPAPPKICEDTRSDCDTINHIGEPKASYCARNRNDPAVKECAKTCGFC